VKKFACAAIAACFLSACSEEPDVAIGPCSMTTLGADGDVTIGERLRPFQLVANDGTTARYVAPFAEWFDTKLGVPCTFRSVDGGPEIHCLPATVLPTLNLFVDSACTTRVVAMDPCPQRPRYVSDPAADVCWPSIAAISPILDPIPLGSYVYRFDGTACVVTDPPKGKDLLLIGDPLPWSNFVAATWESKTP